MTGEAEASRAGESVQTASVLEHSSVEGLKRVAYGRYRLLDGESLHRIARELVRRHELLANSATNMTTGKEIGILIMTVDAMLNKLGDDTEDF